MFLTEGSCYESVVSVLYQNIDGPQIAKLLKPGTRVCRGKDWKWGNEVGIFVIDHRIFCGETLQLLFISHNVYNLYNNTQNIYNIKVKQLWFSIV